MTGLYSRPCRCCGEGSVGCSAVDAIEKASTVDTSPRSTSPESTLRFATESSSDAGDRVNSVDDDSPSAPGFSSCFHVPPPARNVTRVYHNRKRTAFTEYVIDQASSQAPSLVRLLDEERFPTCSRVRATAFAAGVADEDKNLDDAVRTPDKHGRAPLLIAAMRQQCDAVTALLELGAEVDCTDPASGWTPLMYAASNGNLAIVEELLASGASVNDFAAPHDWNPLCVAILSNNMHVACRLLEAGAELNLITRRHPQLAETYRCEMHEWRTAASLATSKSLNSVAACR
eukprot:TRINITY_DN49283_c0_g1_i1.p1 TRINITY_DN49283_c0_g1~~TRINITY_DN49283_c0_g1_i1.p1  ORF type:complete len:304 (+),score=43.35 TRINITY_DN49283_c0_g1_i1:51-914(+)